MIPVTLIYCPDFEIGKSFNLDTLEINTVLPKIPERGEDFWIQNFAPRAGGEGEWEELGDYSRFQVKKCEYYWRGPERTPHIHVHLELKLQQGEDQKRAEARVCELLIKVYLWRHTS